MSSMASRKTALAAAAVMAVAVAGMASPAEANHKKLGAFAAGVVIGGALSHGLNNHHYPAYGPALHGPVYGSGCVWQKQKVWDPYPYGHWEWRNVQVCY